MTKGPNATSPARGVRTETARVGGLFAGIGGLELGLHAAGYTTTLLCEADAGAKAVLQKRCPGSSQVVTARFVDDVKDLKVLTDVDIVTAGFPCQDLSQAGKTEGISGARSGLVTTLFRTLAKSTPRPGTLVLENVPFMLRLDKGRAMSHVVERLEKLGYSWAYRIVDAQAFGLPQRRERVVIVASTVVDPKLVLLRGDASKPDRVADEAAGFYWTEGNRGLGWAPDAVPPLKGGSGLGIPSPPAIAIRDKGIFTPTIEAAEQLQGFARGWTSPISAAGVGERHRWRLVGNAVSVPMAKWIGGQLKSPASKLTAGVTRLDASDPWPVAAYGAKGERFAVAVGRYPMKRSPKPLLKVVGDDDLEPLSVRATAGFLSRLEASCLHTEDWFIPELERHLAAQRKVEASARARARR